MIEPASLSERIALVRALKAAKQARGGAPWLSAGELNRHLAPPPEDWPRSSTSWWRGECRTYRSYHPIALLAWEQRPCTTTVKTMAVSPTPSPTSAKRSAG